MRTPLGTPMGPLPIRGETSLLVTSGGHPRSTMAPGEAQKPAQEHRPTESPLAEWDPKYSPQEEAWFMTEEGNLLPGGWWKFKDGQIAVPGTLAPAFVKRFHQRIHLDHTVLETTLGQYFCVFQLSSISRVVPPGGPKCQWHPLQGIRSRLSLNASITRPQWNIQPLKPLQTGPFTVILSTPTEVTLWIHHSRFKLAAAEWECVPDSSEPLKATFWKNAPADRG
ncbi:uncharacterized protein LOC120596816 [Pteropus medius]|uniref:uncharacterized protein LOC120596816 n=1 Tax=Pteropus vampyrus TaxID=132908 RepID=UPI00196BB174|nr:uncharacterized protein LOC120596816 [Pteropus giganteus]